MMVVCAPQSWDQPFGLLEFVLETRVSGRSCSLSLEANASKVSLWTVCKVLEWPARGSFVGITLPTIQTWLFKTEFVFVSSMALALFGRLSKLSNLKFKKKYFCIQWQFLLMKKKVISWRIFFSVIFNFVFVLSSPFLCFPPVTGLATGSVSSLRLQGIAFASVFTRWSCSYSVVHFLSGLFQYILILCLTPWLGCLIYLAVLFLWI